MVLAVNWPPQEPADGTGDAFELVQILVVDLAGGMGADGLEDVLHRHVAAVEAAGQDRAAIHEDRRAR